MSGFSQTCPLFQASELYGGGGFFNFPKISRFVDFVDSLWRTRVLLIFEPLWNARSTRKLLEVK